MCVCEWAGAALSARRRFGRLLALCVAYAAMGGGPTPNNRSYRWNGGELVWWSSTQDWTGLACVWPLPLQNVCLAPGGCRASRQGKAWHGRRESVRQATDSPAPACISPHPSAQYRVCRTGKAGQLSNTGMQSTAGHTTERERERDTRRQLCTHTHMHSLLAADGRRMAEMYIHAQYTARSTYQVPSAHSVLRPYSMSPVARGCRSAV